MITDKIPEPAFLLQISQTRGKQIVLIYRSSYLGVKLSSNFRFEISPDTQYIPQYPRKRLETY